MIATAPQLTFEDAGKQHRPPGKDQQSEQAVLRTLRQFAACGRRWVKAQEIAESLGWGWSESVRRKVTAAVEGLGWRIIGNKCKGSVGYCLTAYATVDELDHYDRQTAAQIEKMTAKRIAVRNYRHRGERAA